MSNTLPWYEVRSTSEIDSPSLLLYRRRLSANIGHMLELVDGDVHRLMPHIKTNKSTEVVRHMMAEGIDRFKTSTLAESRLAANAGANTVLLAHQLVGPKPAGLLELVKSYPNTEFATLIDNIESACQLNDLFDRSGNVIGVYIDINSGMNRSGIRPGPEMLELLNAIDNMPALSLKGFHVYDGHLRQPALDERTTQANEEFLAVERYIKPIREADPNLELVVGGTPSFSVHRQYPDRICSPGTCVFWDWGYGDILAEQPFEYAVVVFSRVISKPARGVLTIDMGHKAVAPEQPIDKRIRFLNAPGAELIGQSEEHGLVRVDDDSQFKVGDVLYGVPHHVCPTVNLYSYFYVIEKGKLTETCEIDGRIRTIHNE